MLLYVFNYLCLCKVFSKFAFESLTAEIILTVSGIKIRRLMAAFLLHVKVDPESSLNLGQHPCSDGMNILSDTYLSIH